MTSTPNSRTIRVMLTLNIEDRDGKAVISGPDGEIGSVDRDVFLAAIAEEFGVTITAAEPQIVWGARVVRRSEPDGPVGIVRIVHTPTTPGAPAAASVSFAGLEPIWVRLSDLAPAP